jgi:uncharacterized membrane protein
MSAKTYLIWTVVINIIVMVLVGWSVHTGNVLIPGPTVIVAAVILYLCRKRIKEVIEDERAQKIGDWASRHTIEIVIIIMAVVATTLLAMSSDDSTTLEAVGITLACSISLLLLVYGILHVFFSRKLGG